MTQQIINNGESGLVARTKINDNFTEVYNLTANPYPRVANYAALPDPTTNAGKIYIVEASTGIWPVRRSAGMWISNGTAWFWLGNEALIAEQITFAPEGGVVSTNVQAAIVEVAGIVSGGASGTATLTLPDGLGVFEHVVDIVTAGVVPTSRIFLSLGNLADTDENSAEMLDLGLNGTAGDGIITVTATFDQLTSGPIKINWQAK